MTLSDYLAERGLKPSQFADRMGVPASTVLRILNGSRAPRIATAAKIVELTGGSVTFAELVPVAAPVAATPTQPEAVAV